MSKCAQQKLHLPTNINMEIYGSYCHFHSIYGSTVGAMMAWEDWIQVHSKMIQRRLTFVSGLASNVHWL